jgi:lysophospholipase L1-like esterase
MRLMARLVVLAVLAGSLSGTGMRADASTQRETHYYLALGDSVAADIPHDVLHYPGRLLRLVRDDFNEIRLKNLACPGESTDTMMDGGICSYRTGSQLDQAMAFLDAHQGHIEFITITVGTNDILGTDGVFCLDFDTGLLHLECIQREMPGVQSNLVMILEALENAAPGVPILGMNYYNPFLGFWVLLENGRRVAMTDEESWEAFNGGLVAAYRDAGTTLVDVAGPEVFDTANFTDRVPTEEWGVIPVNVANACSWTYFCRRGDVHPNAEGHSLIAEAFERALDP